MVTHPSHPAHDLDAALQRLELTFNRIDGMAQLIHERGAIAPRPELQRASTGLMFLARQGRDYISALRAAAPARREA